jgi:hypothetical protein
MSVPYASVAVAVRAEPAIAAEEGDGEPCPRICAVPPHQPWTDWPRPDPPPGPVAEAASDQGSQAQAAAVRRDPAAEGQAGPRQFAVLLTEALAGVRPVRQLRPWLSERGHAHLHRLLPLFADGHRPRITRVLTTRPASDVIEMTLIVTSGPRTRALAVRLERIYPAPRGALPAGGGQLAPRTARPGSMTAPAVTSSARWQCTDIEAA